LRILVQRQKNVSNKLFKYTRRIFLNKKVATFLACLCIASFLWLVNALNRNYKETISIAIQYINLPKNKMLATELPKTIQAEIKTTGAKLFFIRFNLPKTILVIDPSPVLAKKPNQQTVTISTAQFAGSFSKLLNTEVELLKVKPDSIYFSFGRSYRRIVPVKPLLQISFDPFYNYRNKVNITPSSVTLFGDSVLLSHIDSVNTEKIVLNDFNSSISQKAKLHLPEELENRVSLSTDEVLLEIDIDKYTETYVEVPVEAKNVPAGLQLKTFPDKVKLTVQVPMSEFENIKPGLFKATVDYKEGTTNKLKVAIQGPGPNIKVTKISPERVEYILRK
jgi:YbbR domain-containing protein